MREQHFDIRKPRHYPTERQNEVARMRDDTAIQNKKAMTSYLKMSSYFPLCLQLPLSLHSRIIIEHRKPRHFSKQQRK